MGMDRLVLVLVIVMGVLSSWASWLWVAWVVPEAGSLCCPPMHGLNSSSEGISLSSGQRLVDRHWILAGWGSFLEPQQFGHHHPHSSTRYHSVALLLAILLVSMLVIVFLLGLFSGIMVVCTEDEQ